MLEYLPPLNDHNLPYPDTIHPIVVHFVIAMVLFSVVCDAIGYFTKTPSNKVERLHAAIREGKNPLTYDAKFGYLPSLLRTEQLL
jgi:hypothetical protein